MALVEGGKQRAISVDYPVYYSPGACLDILNGFMADAGDPALGGGGRRRGGSGEAPAPPLGHPGQRPEPPRGRGHGTHRGGLGAGWGEPASRTPNPAPPSRTSIPIPQRGAEPRFTHGSFYPGSKVSGKAGLGLRPELPGARNAPRSRSAPGTARHRHPGGPGTRRRRRARPTLRY